MGDPLGNFLLTDADFADLTRVMLEIADKHAGGRVVSVLEGGYSLTGLAAGVRAHVQAIIYEPGSPRIDGFRGEFLWELDIAERQLTAIADAIPAETYAWRSNDKARSISEVLVHISAGNFMLLDAAGGPCPRNFIPSGRNGRAAISGISCAETTNWKRRFARKPKSPIC